MTEFDYIDTGRCSTFLIKLRENSWELEKKASSQHYHDLNDW